MTVAAHILVESTDRIELLPDNRIRLGNGAILEFRDLGSVHRVEEACAIIREALALRERVWSGDWAQTEAAA